MGPIHYPPSPTLIFKKNEDTGKLDLVATGNITSCNPDRIVLKRIRLAGHPFKINKRSATVRYGGGAPRGVAPRGSLHGGRSTRAAPQGVRRSFFSSDVRSILMIL